MAKAEKLLTIPNMLTLVRFVLLFPTLWALLNHYPVVAVALGVVAYISDLLDGWIARKFHQQSEWGKILDPLVDKIFVAAVVLTLYFQGVVPGWYLGIIVIRDGLILLGGLYAKYRKGVVLQSLPVGRAAVTSVAATLVLMVLQSKPVIVNAFLALSSALLIFSFAVYTRRWVDEVILSDRRKKQQ